MTGGLRLTLLFLCEDAPVDVDNIIKPIQDALIRLVYDDDELVTDVDSHRRFFSDPINLTGLPLSVWIAAWLGIERVYVRVEDVGVFRRLW